MRQLIRDIRWAWQASHEWWPNGHVRRVARFARLRIQVAWRGGAL